MRDAEASAWQCLADACLEHDVVHEHLALEELERLRAYFVPRQHVERVSPQMNHAQG